MGGALGLGIGLFVIGLFGLLFFPWGGVLVAIVGLLLIIWFLLGLVGRAMRPRQ